MKKMKSSLVLIIFLFDLFGGIAVLILSWILVISIKENNGCMIAVLLLNLLALHFTFAIGSSFLVDENECCRKKFDDRCCSVFALCIFYFFIPYISAKGCGKHISRYIGIIAVMFISITNCILTTILLSILSYNISMMVSIIVITALMSMFNFISILLPNLDIFSPVREDIESTQRPILSPQIQPPSYIPPSSDYANVPNYPPSNPAYPSGNPTSGI
jgi:riboflavin transporter FmnP